MGRKFKALGLAMMAVFAMSAIVAQAAQAHEFETGASSAFLTGNNESGTKDSFSVASALGPASVECTTSHFVGIGTVANGAETAEVHPEYSGCEFLGSTATIDTTGCNYVFHGATPTENMALVDVECSGTNKIIVTTPNVCNLTIGTNTSLSGVKYTDLNTSPMTITVTATVAGIPLTKDAPTGTNNCALVTGTTGTYNSKEIVEGFTNSGEGTKVGITAKTAQTHQFETEQGTNAFLTGNNESGTKDSFSVASALGPARVECTTSHFVGIGTVANGAETAEVHPEYSGCEFLGSTATIDTTGCNYVFHGATPTENMALVDVECSGTNKIIVTTPNVCNLTIGTNTSLNGVKYTNLNTSPMTITVTATVTGIPITKDAPTGTNNCALVTGTTGSYSSKEIIEGFTDEHEGTKIDITFR